MKRRPGEASREHSWDLDHRQQANRVAGSRELAQDGTGQVGAVAGGGYFAVVGVDAANNRSSSAGNCTCSGAQHSRVETL